MLGSASNSFSQLDFSKDYRPVKISGAIPEEFCALSFPKVEAAIDTLKRGFGVKFYKKKSTFITESQYEIDALLRSGMILFGDPLTEYVNKVADNVMKHTPELRNQLRFYVIKSEQVNAFSTAEGIVMVSVGMLAHLENEAQLAFVIAHEVSHFRKKHAISTYIANHQMQLRGQLSNASLNDLLRSMSKHSRSVESEADMDGLELFEQSDYNYDAAFSIFDVFEAGDLAFIKAEWSIDWLAEKRYQLAKGLHLDEVFVRAVAFDELYRTHPLAKERKAALEEKLGNKSYSSRKAFIQFEDLFYDVRQRARFELVRYFNQSRQYVKSLYLNTMLLNEFPQNKYLLGHKLKALYFIARYREDEKYEEIAPAFEEVSGPMQRIYYAFENINVFELYLIVVREAWKLHMEYPDMELFQRLSDDATIRSVMISHVNIDAFNRNVKYNEPANQLPGGVTVDTLLGNWNTIFDGFFTNGDEFTNYYNTMADSATARIRVRTKYENRTKQDKKREARADRRQRIKQELEGFSLGLDSVMMLSPIYIRANMDRGVVRYIRSEKRQREFVNKVEEYSESIGVETELFDVRSLEPNDTTQFADMTELYDYLEERYAHRDISMAPVGMENAKDFVKKHGTRYVVLTGVFSRRKKRHILPWGRCGGLDAYILIPTMLVINIARQQTDLVTVVLDIVTGEEVMVDFRSVRRKDSQDLINSHIYNMFHQIKRTPKQS